MMNRWIEQLGVNLKVECLFELDDPLSSLLLESNLSLGDFEATGKLELELLNSFWWGIVEDWEVNLLFFRRSLSSPMCEVKDDRGDKAEALENLEGLLVASFESTNRVVDAYFEGNKSGLGLWDEGEDLLKIK